MTDIDKIAEVDGTGTASVGSSLPNGASRSDAPNTFGFDAPRMRVGLFLTKDTSRVGGGATFERQLISDLLRLAKESGHQFVAFTPGSQVKLSSGETIPEVVQVKWILPRRILGGIANIVNLFFARVLVLPYPLPYEGWLDSTLFKHRIEFFVNLTPSTMTMEIPYLTCIWDLQQRLQPFFPEGSGRGRWARSDGIFTTLIRRAAFVVALGQQGKREVREFYGVAEERIKVLDLPTPQFALEAAAKPRAALPAIYDFQPGYLFYPAQFWPHKNHVAIIWALKILREKYSYCPTAVFVGADLGNLAHVRTLAEKFEVGKQVRWLGFVPQADLVALYQNALALVFPSMFGPQNFPPLEAFALGCPVIASTVPGAEDQLGDAALLVDATDYRTLAETIFKLYTSPQLRGELIERGRSRALANTGQDFAREILSLLDEFAAVRMCWSGEHRYTPSFSLKKLLRG